MAVEPHDDFMSRFDLVAPIDPEVERPKQIAPRPADLDRKVLGLLDNRKGNADALLLRIGERLGEKYELFDIVYLTKPIFSRPAPADQIEQLKQCDAVLTAIAD